VLPATLYAAGCTAPADPVGPGPAGSTGPSPGPGSPVPVSDAGLCARLVIHWAREALDGGTYGDYQSMGLSHGQYEILMDVVDAGRAVRRRQGRPAADELTRHRARTACAARYRHGAPTGSPWS
jgi:hypothetical protein